MGNKQKTGKKKHNDSPSITRQSFFQKLQEKILFPKPNNKRKINSLCPKTKILFVGNPGSGKSTLLNCFIQDIVFKSGITTGSGLTTQLNRIEKKNIVLFDTPGLSDIKIRKIAAEEIRTAFLEGGHYHLIFVVTIEGGRIRNDDLTTVRLVLDALCNIDELKFGWIVNKVSKNYLNKLTTDHNFFCEFIANLNTDLPLTSESVYISLENEDAKDLNNVLLPYNIELENFVCNTGPVLIDKNKVQKIKESNYELIKERLIAETTKLKEDNEVLQKQLQKIQRDSEEKIMQLEVKVESLQNLVRKFQDSEQRNSTVKCEDVILMRDTNTFKGEIINDLRSWLLNEFPELDSLITQSFDHAEEVMDNSNPNLTVPMVASIALYTCHSTFYQILNRELRVTSNPKETKWKHYLWYALEAQKQLPNYVGNSYRGVNLRFDQLSENYRVGSVIKYNCFSSTSLYMNVIKCFLEDNGGGILFIFQNCVSGVDVSKWSIYPEEKEILFFPGASFKILDIYTNDELTTIVLTDIKFAREIEIGKNVNTDEMTYIDVSDVLRLQQEYVPIATTRFTGEMTTIVSTDTIKPTFSPDIATGRFNSNISTELQNFKSNVNDEMTNVVSTDIKEPTFSPDIATGRFKSNISTELQNFKSNDYTTDEMTTVVSTDIEEPASSPDIATRRFKPPNYN